MSFLYDRKGNRKYLTAQERCAFLDAARQAPPEVYTFCLTLAYTGARISEVLALTPDRIDFSDQLIIIESLKKRKRGVFRAVPMPKEFLTLIDTVHGLRTLQQRRMNSYDPIWSWCRTTAWKKVKAAMEVAGIHGVQASPKGLRHCLGVVALQKGVPINLIMRWLGHSRQTTTAIYADAVGEEERSLAAPFWKSFN